MGDVLADDAAVEHPHGELPYRLAGSMGGDGADRLAQNSIILPVEQLAVAGGAHPVGRLAGQHRARADRMNHLIVAEPIAAPRRRAGCDGPGSSSDSVTASTRSRP